MTIDCHGHKSGSHREFENTLEGIAAMAEWSAGADAASRGEVMFIFEHTGLYSHKLIQYLGGNGYLFHVAPGLEIKRSLGIARGKDDRVDARRIALYGHEKREGLQPYMIPGKTLDAIKRLIALRRKLVTQRAGHRAAHGEQGRVLDMGLEAVLLDVRERVIEAMDAEISKIEKELDRLVDLDPELKKQYGLLTGIKGVGPVTARYLIVHTVGFQAFATWRKFASYCGIAPFPNTSGTSVRGMTKVSHLAHKEGKKLLNMCAWSAIQHNPEMRAYYERRVAQGKNEMSTINIIRNKILARAFAVVKRGTPYVNTMGFAS